MSRRAVAAWGAASLVVVGALAAALINELHGGLAWWIATAGVVLLWAAVAAWFAYRTDRSAGVRQGAGSVSSGHISGSVMTETTIESQSGSTPVEGSGKDSDGDVLGEGAVRARTIGGDVSSRTNLRASPPAPGTPPADPGPPAIR